MDRKLHFENEDRAREFALHCLGKYDSVLATIGDCEDTCVVSLTSCVVDDVIDSALCDLASVLLAKFGINADSITYGDVRGEIMDRLKFRHIYVYDEF